jgi:hypothetical protein
MKLLQAAIASAMLLAMAQIQAQQTAVDIEPGVRTSSATAAVGAVTTAAPAAPAAAPAAAPPAGASRATIGGRVMDRVELENTQITGNRELPRVMYVVPWKKPDLGEFAGRPPKSLLDELLTPVDRDVFKRQNRYFAALQPDAAAGAAAPAVTNEQEISSATAPRAGDEK